MAVVKKLRGTKWRREDEIHYLSRPAPERVALVRFLYLSANHTTQIKILVLSSLVIIWVIKMMIGSRMGYFYALF